MPQGPIRLAELDTAAIKLLPRTLAEVVEAYPEAADGIVVMISDSDTAVNGATIMGGSNKTVLARSLNLNWLVL